MVSKNAEGGHLQFCEEGPSRDNSEAGRPEGRRYVEGAREEWVPKEIFQWGALAEARFRISGPPASRKAAWDWTWRASARRTSSE